jgi:hypothetical protein
MPRRVAGYHAAGSARGELCAWGLPAAATQVLKSWPPDCRARDGDDVCGLGSSKHKVATEYRFIGNHEWVTRICWSTELWSQRGPRDGRRQLGQ